jgi:hypothetical protein
MGGGAQKSGGGGPGQGLRKQQPLRASCAALHQVAKLFRRLDSFGGNLDFQFVGERHDGIEDLLFRAADVAHE